MIMHVIVIIFTIYIVIIFRNYVFEHQQCWFFPEMTWWGTIWHSFLPLFLRQWLRSPCLGGEVENVMMHQHCLKPFNGGMAARLHSVLPESQQFLINGSVEESLEEEEALCGALGITLAESTPIKKAVVKTKTVKR